MSEDKTLAQIAGENTRALRKRHGATLEVLADHARWQGLRWDASRVANWEAGRTAMKLETLIAFSGALSSLLGVPVSINDLLAHTGQIAINNNLSVDSELLPEILRGSPTVPIGPDSPGGGRRLWDADRNLAKRIGVSPTEMNRACRALWGRSFLEERDHRAGPDASSQKRGYITRLIEDELRTALREKAS